MSVILIRHGKTEGNLRHAYIGSRTDEPLCAQGIAEIIEGEYPPAERVFVSPMTRCIETARLIYPDVPQTIINDFRECDFGDFEGKTYDELNGLDSYQTWINSCGEMPFPGGESKAAFSDRCVAAFDALTCLFERGSAAFIVHGGTIMAIMEKYAVPHHGYYDYQIGNGNGYILERNGTFRRIK